MSWTSNETGRPQEDGGHQRINISADYYTRQVLNGVENKSNFVEHSIRVFTDHKCVHFVEPAESFNNSRLFKDGAVFEFTSSFDNNAIEQVNVSFNFLGAEGDVEFRVVANGNRGSRLVEKSSSGEYSLSHLYSAGELGLKRFEVMLRGKDKYIFRFQFRPLDAFGRGYVKNINMFIDLIESPFIGICSEENNHEAGCKET
jgi:hypothetical protein